MLPPSTLSLGAVLYNECHGGPLACKHANTTSGTAFVHVLRRPGGGGPPQNLLLRSGPLGNASDWRVSDISAQLTAPGLRYFAPSAAPGTVYGLSKAAVNAYTKLAARTYPALRVNACSPGFCRTDIAGPNADYSAREPKAPALGADVVVKLLFDDALSQATGKFFKECSKPGTALENAVSREEPW